MIEVAFAWLFALSLAGGVWFAYFNVRIQRLEEAARRQRADSEKKR